MTNLLAVICPQKWETHFCVGALFLSLTFKVSFGFFLARRRTHSSNRGDDDDVREHFQGEDLPDFCSAQ